MKYNQINKSAGIVRGERILKQLIPILLLAAIILGGCAPAAANPTEDADIKSNVAQEALAAGEQTISGVVISGGDTTAQGLLDAPRKFVYQVELSNGQTIDLAYTAYPPGPAADQHKYELDFHAGQIQVGDYLEAHGVFATESNTLTIDGEGDFIKTYAEKP